MADIVIGIVALLGAIGGVLFYGRRQRVKGRDDVVKEMIQQDRKNAAKVKEKLDANDRDGDAVERLRKSNRLRD